MKRLTAWLANLHKGSRVFIRKGNECLSAIVTDITCERIMVSGYSGFFHREDGQYVVCFYNRPHLVPDCSSS